MKNLKKCVNIFITNILNTKKKNWNVPVVEENSHQNQVYTNIKKTMKKIRASEDVVFDFFCHQSFSFLLLRFNKYSQAAKRKQKNFQCPKKKSKNIDVNQICCPLWTALLNKPAQLRRIKCKVYTQCKHLASVKVAVTHKQAS